MFCSNCGASEQTRETYCRACGEFLVSSSTGSRVAFGGTTPQQNLTSINVLSVIAAVISLIAGILMYVTNFSVPIYLYLGAALLLCNAAWHLSNFAVGLKLKRRLTTAKGQPSETIGEIPAANTSELLTPGNLDSAVPSSVTESTTKHLAEKVKRRLS